MAGGRTLEASVIVRLRDMLSSPLAGLQRRLSGLAALGQRIGVLGGIAASISFAAPIASAAEWDTALRDIAVTAGYSGQAAEAYVARISGAYEALALRVGQASASVAETAGQMIASGMAEDKVNRLLPIVGKVATASRAAMGDIGAAAATLADSFKVADGQMEGALTSLVVAGKAGNVELKDMAKYLPSLGPAARNVGLAGREGVATIGAALEVVRRGAGDTATAANNLKNLLAKSLAPDVAKNFRKFGVDIGAAMKDAAAKGMDPFETMLAKIVRITGISQDEIQQVYGKAKMAGMTDAGALEAVRKKVEAIGGAAKIAQIFGDQQAIEALLPLLAGLDDYKAIKAQMLAAGGDLLAADFGTQMAAAQKQLDRFGEIGTQAMHRVGKAFATNLPAVNRAMEGLLGWVKAIDERWPGLIDTTLSWSGAILLLLAGLAAAGPVFSVLAAGAGVLGAALGLLLSPLGLVVAAFAAAAAIIWANWSDFAGDFEGLWGGIVDAFGWASRAVRAFAAGDLVAARGAWQAFVASLGRIGNALSIILAGVGRHMVGYIDQAGTALFGGEAWGKIRAWATGIYQQVRDAILAGDWSALGSMALEALANGWRVAAPALSAVGRWTLDQIVTGLRAAGDGITAALQWLAGFFRAFDWPGVGRLLMQRIVDGLRQATVDIGAWLSDKILQTDWAAVGRQIWEAIKGGMTGAAGAIGSYLSGVFAGGGASGQQQAGAAAGATASDSLKALLSAPPQQQTTQATVTVRAAPGTEIVNTETRGPMRVSAPGAAGTVQGRP